MRDDRAYRGGARRGADPQLPAPCTHLELVHCPQRDVLRPDRARANELERIDVDELQVVLLARRDGTNALAGEQLGGDAPGVQFQCRGAVGRQCEMSGQELVVSMLFQN